MALNGFKPSAELKQHWEWKAFASPPRGPSAGWDGRGEGAWEPGQSPPLVPCLPVWPHITGGGPGAWGPRASSSRAPVLGPQLIREKGTRAFRKSARRGHVHEATKTNRAPVNSHHTEATCSHGCSCQTHQDDAWLLSSSLLLRGLREKQGCPRSTAWPQSSNLRSR